MRRASREDSTARRRSRSKRQQVNVRLGHTSASIPVGIVLARNYPAPAPDAAVSSTDAEKEEDENSFQAQTAAEEGSVKVPPAVINLCRQHEHIGFFLQQCVRARVCVSTSVPLLSSCAQVPKRIEVHSVHTYVALYKFLPQEQNDLELQ